MDLTGGIKRMKKRHREEGENPTQTGFSDGEATASWKSACSLHRVEQRGRLLHTAEQEGKADQ